MSPARRGACATARSSLGSFLLLVSLGGGRGGPPAQGHAGVWQGDHSRW